MCPKSSLSHNHPYIVLKARNRIHQNTNRRRRRRNPKRNTNRKGTRQQLTQIQPLQTVQVTPTTMNTMNPSLLCRLHWRDRVVPSRRKRRRKGKRQPRIVPSLTTLTQKMKGLFSPNPKSPKRKRRRKHPRNCLRNPVIHKCCPNLSICLAIYGAMGNLVVATMTQAVVAVTGIPGPQPLRLCRHPKPIRIMRTILT